LICYFKNELLGNSVIRKVNSSGIISTIAGNHISGYAGDGGPASAAKISDPLGLVFDGAGNLYFSNDGYYAVRKINTEGIISTVAGTGTAGYNGDNIPATNAQVKLTGYVTIGPSGELYIPDYGNFRVRKIDAAGIISTVAGNGVAANTGDGGAATAAALLYPLAVIFDPAGNMYISDGNLGVIRKVNTSGIISTIAGNGTEGYLGDGGPATAAEFNVDVNCSAIDASGNFYIADPNNNRIRRITYNSTSVNEVNNTSQNVTIYPNPTHDKITITTVPGLYNGEENNMESVEVVNVMGVVIASPQPSPGERELSIKVSDLPSGIYFVKVNGVYAGRFVKE
jgi:type IX secretion system substrate protein